MYDLSAVKAAALTFGTAGTSTALTHSTSTTNPMALPRGSYSLSVQSISTVTATGTASSTQAVTSIGTLQASNDGANWFAVATATIGVTAITSATFTGAEVATASANGAAAITQANNAYAYGRVVLSAVGTSGRGYVFFGS